MLAEHDNLILGTRKFNSASLRDLRLHFWHRPLKLFPFAGLNFAHESRVLFPHLRIIKEANCAAASFKLLFLTIYIPDACRLREHTWIQ